MSSDAEIPNKTLLVMPVVSDFYGRPFEEGKEFIGLARIEFNRTKWVAFDALSSFLILDGGRLIIRREGRMIYVERE